jgi:hypothetical protein
MTAWSDRVDRQAMSPAALASMVDREAKRFERRLFTLTPREELDGLGRAQRLMDQAFVLRAREVVAMYNRIAKDSEEFVVDEVALALGFSPTGAGKVVFAALALAALPGMLEAVDSGHLTSNHALSVLRELDTVELNDAQRAAIAYVVIHRAANKTPGELMSLTRKLILQVDLPAAMDREQVATKKRKVLFYPVANGQGITQLRGPIADTAMIEAVLAQAKLDHPQPADLSVDQWEYQLMLQLLTGQIQPGNWQAVVVTPFATATGGDLELAEIPGLGPVLPATARQLLEDAAWTQVAVDTSGSVIAVGDPTSAPKPASPRPASPKPATPNRAAPKPAVRARENWELSLAQLMSTPPKARLMPEQLSSAAYSTPARLRRYLQARDRTCVFPGCHKRVTDVDHRVPWPIGATAAENLQLLCRHHHRAKQAVFRVELTDDGDYLWTTRGGWQFVRHRQGY